MSAGVEQRIAPALRLRAWARRHSYSFFSSLGALLSHRVGSLMTVTVLGVALLLPIGLHVALINVDRLDLSEAEWGTLTVFMTAGGEESEARALVRDASARPDVAAVSATSPEDGLAELREAAGFGDSLELLERNPIPWALSVTPAVRGDQDTAAVVSDLTAWLEARPGVDSVSYDAKWLQRLGRLVELGRALVTVLGLLFGLAVVVIVGNTIRLDVAARADEIEVMSLVGATDSFIRQPFLYSGFWYGLLGGIVAMILVNAILLYLELPLGRLLESYGHSAGLRGLNLAQTVGLLAGGGLLGLAGALLTVQRYLRDLRLSGGLGRR